MLSGEGAATGDGSSYPRRRAGVVGSPIDHSLSPVLHRAAYAALGLSGWTYDRTEVRSGELAEHVARLGPEWVGLSVTMPGKEEALALADTASEAARLTGAANTLVRDGGGWAADNTDVPGLQDALREAGLAGPGRAAVLGAGATARSAMVALRGLGFLQLDMVVRDEVRPETAALAERLGMRIRPRVMDATRLRLGESHHDLVLSTLPAQAEVPTVALTRGTPALVMDVAYAPWPSAFASAVAALGPDAPVVHRGTGMLLHQAARQVKLMTGHDGPVEAMRAALAAVGDQG